MARRRFVARQVSWPLVLAGAGAVGLLAAAFRSRSSVPRDSKNWPPPPPGVKPLVTNAERFAAFGPFEYAPAPQPNDPEHITILGDWVQQHIAYVSVPELIGVSGAPADGRVPFYKEAGPQLQALFRAWKDAGLLDRILTWNGSWNPRFVRGSTTYLSNHAFGTGFDINAAWNGYGAEPALVGSKGCVRELAEIAGHLGWFWGGWFGHKDGMHFEIATLGVS